MLEILEKLGICDRIMLVLTMYLLVVDISCYQLVTIVKTFFLRVNSFMLFHVNGITWVKLECRILIVSGRVLKM